VANNNWGTLVEVAHVPAFTYQIVVAHEGPDFDEFVTKVEAARLVTRDDIPCPKHFETTDNFMLYVSFTAHPLFL
jgi:hypothetical protein